MQKLTGSIAFQLGSLAFALASGEKKNVSIAIVDERGEKLFLATMDDASIQTRDFALRKAYTSVRTRKTSFRNAKACREDGLVVTELDPYYISYAGGIPLKDPSGMGVLGALGISGLAQLDDEKFAQEIVGKWNEQVKDGESTFTPSGISLLLEC